MSTDTNAVNLIATFRALPGHTSTVAGLISAYAEVVAQEPGMVFFEVYTDRDDADAFVVVERYVDEEAFQAHLAGEAGKQFNAELSPLIEDGGAALQFLQPVG